MPAALRLPLSATGFPAGIGCERCLVVLLRFSGDDGKEKLLLPSRRLAGAIKPRIGGLPRATQSRNDHGGGIRGKRISEGHGQILPDKKKYAMQKINLDKYPQCRQSLRMSNANKMTANEKLIGTETMKARIEAFHADRLERIGMEWKMEFFRTATWSRAKILQEFRALPENADNTPGRAIDFEVPTPKTAAEMSKILKGSRIVLTLG